MRLAERNAGGTVVGRAVQLLNAFRADDDAVPVSELARRAGLSKATAHRLANELLAAGFLERGKDGLLLGTRLFELGSMVRRHRDLHEVALATLEDLFVATRETVHLGVRDGLDVVYVAKLIGREDPATPSRVGKRMPLYATALGKAMLAYDEKVLECVLAVDRPALTERTITTEPELRAELAEVRQHGVAFERGESQAGVWCAAAPVFVQPGYAPAAISVSVRHGRRSLQHLAPTLVAAAQVLAQEIRRTGHYERMTNQAG